MLYPCINLSNLSLLHFSFDNQHLLKHVIDVHTRRMLIKLRCIFTKITSFKSNSKRLITVCCNTCWRKKPTCDALIPYEPPWIRRGVGRGGGRRDSLPPHSIFMVRGDAFYRQSASDFHATRALTSFPTFKQGRIVQRSGLYNENNKNRNKRFKKIENQRFHI